jgi:hypothetical protein
MKRKPNDPDPISGNRAPEASPSAWLARRRLLRGGLGAAPVLLVSAPRSVMAGACTTASAFTSLSTHSGPVALSTCSGRGPDYWKNTSYQSQWPDSCIRNGANATLFGSIFGAGDEYSGQSLIAILELSATTGKAGLARHVVAALLNARKVTMVPASVLSETTLKTVWSDFVAKGYYEPTAGIQWYPDSSSSGTAGGITQWLKSTMI